QSSHDGRVVAVQAWDPLEASQCERGESATKAQQYTRPRMLHWEIMGLRAAIALLMLLGLGLVALVGREVLIPADALERGTVVVGFRPHDGGRRRAGRLYEAAGT